MQKKFSFERLLPRVPELTERDCGEMLAYNPPLRNQQLAHRLKAYWAAGMKQGQMAKITGYEKGYIKKITACFSRALTMPTGVLSCVSYSRPTPKKEVEKWQITSAIKQKKYSPKGIWKKRKSLTVNFSTPSTGTPYRKSEKIFEFSIKDIPKGATAIPLTKGHFAIIDDCDFERVSQYSWYSVLGHKTHYAWTTINGKRVAMHRFLLGITEPNIQCDHINGRGYDNRRGNIRACTRAENQRNQGANKRNTSGFKGVSWNTRERRWRAQIKVNGKRIHLGHFISVVEAAKAYNEAAIKYHGEFANINEV